MSFTPKTAPCSGKINAVTLGTGDQAIVIGGQNVLPFYTFDAAIEHAPKIGVEISDAAENWDVPGLVEFYAGCTTMAERAKKAETMEGCDFICLNFESADPNGGQTLYSAIHLQEFPKVQRLVQLPHQNQFHQEFLKLEHS